MKPRTKAARALTLHKIGLARAVTGYGVDVLMCDADTVWQRDPTGYFAGWGSQTLLPPPALSWPAHYRPLCKRAGPLAGSLPFARRQQAGFLAGAASACSTGRLPGKELPCGRPQHRRRISVTTCTVVSRRTHGPNARASEAKSSCVTHGRLPEP